MRSLDTDWSRTYRWTGSYPGYGFPRAAVGDYKIRTVARCRGNRQVRTELVTVKQKTRPTTVSRAEWRQIGRGTTCARVRQIIGYGAQLGQQPLESVHGTG